jgi:peptide/nickel transport system permease protein
MHSNEREQFDASISPDSGLAAAALRPGALSAWRRHPVLEYLIRRLTAGLATLFVASVLIFVATETIGGNPASVVLGKSASPHALHLLEVKLGLDRSLLAQYFSWLGGALRGNLGNSAIALAQGATRAPITHLIGSPLLNSAVLAGLTTLLMIPVSVVLGVISGLRPDRALDRVISTFSLGIASLPEFVLASLLILLFFNVLKLLPPVAYVAPGQDPLSLPKELVLPVLTLLLITSGWSVRQVRAGVVDVLDRSFVAMARLNGLSDRRVVWGYIVRNSVATSIQVIAQNVQYLLGGIIIVESVFAYPGVGKLLVEAVAARDFREVQAVALVIAAVYIIVNILADLIVIFLVPRLRSEWS